MNAHAGDVWLPLFQLQSVVVELRETNVCSVKFTSLSVPNIHFWVKFSERLFSSLMSAGSHQLLYWNACYCVTWKLQRGSDDLLRD